MVKVGIIGPGDVAQIHVPALRAAGAEIVAIAGADEASAQGFARRWDVPRSIVGVDELVALDIDAVVVTTPSPLHAQHALAAIAAGKHVLCEIPLSTDLEEAHRVVEAADESEVLVMVAQTLRFCAPFARLRQLVVEGEITIEHLVSRRLLLRQRDEGWSGNPREWTDSILWHHAGHQLDLALWLLGIDSDSARAAVDGRLGRRWEGNGEPMDLSIRVSAADGRLATLALSYHSRIAAEDCIIITPDETFTVANGALLRNGEVFVEGDSDDDMKKRAIEAQDAAFIAAVRGGQAASPSARELIGLAAALSDIDAALPS